MISDELKTQVQRFQRTRSFALNENLKEELADWFRLTRQATLNVRCGTCLRNAMNDLAKSIQEESNKEIKPAKIQFIGVKQYNYDVGGAPGYHLYILNRAESALEVLASVRG